MAAPNANTFDLASVRRPAKSDFNDIAKSDDSANPPNPQTMPSAAEWNTIEHILLALSRVMPVLVLSILGGATPSVISFPNAKTTLLVGSFTVTRNSAGNVSITWAAGTFPSSISPPQASLNSGPGMIHAVNITNGVQVFTYNAAGAATDRDFTVSVF